MNFKIISLQPIFIKKGLASSGLISAKANWDGRWIWL